MEPPQIEVGGHEGAEDQPNAELLLIQDQLQVKRTNRVSLGIAKPPQLPEPKQQKPVLSKRFRKLPEANHHDLALNSSCSNANPTRQVAASNGMVRSTLETTWLSGLLPLPSPFVPIRGKM